jgi:hypothetical protein
MVKKILPIIIDTNNAISKDLITINIAHMYCDINNNELYTELSKGIYQYIDKYFITSSEEIAKKLCTDFPTNTCYFIGKTSSRLPINVEIYANVNEPVLKYTIDGISYYSMKEIRSLKKMKNSENHMKKFKMNVILTGIIDNTSSMSNIRKIIRSFKNNRLIKNKYIIDEVKSFYCTKKNEFLTSFLEIDEFTELEVPDKNNKCVNIVERSTHMKLYNMIDRSIYYNHWMALDQINNINESNIESNSKDNSNMVNHVHLFKGNDAITIAIDVSRLDKTVKMIDMTEEIFKIITKLENSNYEHETICLFSDIVAIGSCKVMSYYMTLYNLYGSYDFKNNIRNYTNDGIFKYEDYEAMTPKLCLRSDVQLFEHIHSFTDLVITHIFPISDESFIKKKKKHIILVTYHGIFEQFVFIKKALEYVGYVVHDYPFVRYNNEGGAEKLLLEMKKLIDLFCPTYVLWWILNIRTEILHNIVSLDRRIKHLYFNWDEPFNWDKINAKLKSKYLSSAFITCKETTINYLNAGTLNAYCIYTGYSPTLHYPMWIDQKTNEELDPGILEYDFDISFICTNLYDDPIEYPDQIVNRKELIDTIYNNQKSMGYRLAIFGPEKFKDIYPDSYQYFIPYNETGNMFNRSRINLCTHVVGNKKGYLNERIFMIMASGGLLMMDPIPGISDILVNGKNCIFIDKKRILVQIKSILSNYSHYHNLKKEAYKVAKNYTWGDWAMRIHETLLRDYDKCVRKPTTLVVG